ncbi:hypothetical protein HZA56_08945, partial [Candidatus Poribacteria bacterium]|nr:hypothetical protein [Candidatus Poribacteria bacterium]
GNGSVTVEPAGPNYDCGIEVCLTPTPAACWRFDHWEDGAGTSLGSAVPFCMTMDGNKTIGPVFVRTQHNIYITIIGAGHVTPPGGPYDCGTQVDLLAIPDDPCWQFHHWEGDITGTENPVRVIVNHDMHVIAVFVDISITYCRDADTDEYGNPIDSVLDCVAPSGYVDDCTDCDDTNPAVNPGEVETFCNCIDDDCEPATPDNGGCCPDFGIVLESGYSPVGPALHLCGALAEDLCNELNSGGSVCDRVIRYNVSTGMYATHICGLTFNNFSTEDGEGFFLRCSGEVTWWQEGCDIACPIAIELVPGYNPIALPACASTATAEGLCQAIRDAGGSADRVIRYRTETGMYDTHICGLPFNNFALEPGALYFVRSQTTATVLIP